MLDIDPYSLPLDKIDVSLNELYEAHQVLPLFARLRREDPVHYCAESAYGPYWSLTRHEDIMAVDTNHTVFSSAFEDGGTAIDDLQAKPPVEGFTLTAFIGMNPPKHTPFRKAVQPIVSTQSLDSLKDLVRSRTCNVLDSLPRRQEFDWVERVSIELSTQMLATLFDFPFHDRAKLKLWSDATASTEGMEGFVSHEHRVQLLMECLEYFTVLWNERVNAPPKFDLISMLAHDPYTRHMTPLEYLGQVLLLIVGGNDTTRNSMSASINVMNLFPDEYRKVRDDPTLIDSMIKEVIRWQTPIVHMRRTAVADARVRDKLIRKGEKVVMWFYSGNRDETVFPDGDAIKLDRENINRHLAFGFGIHRCMGMRIAELQLRILWQEMLARFRHIHIVKAPKRTRSNQVNGYTEMIVRIED